MERMPLKRHDPHAHIIHPPGRRLMHSIPLRSVWTKVVGRARRGPNAALNLVSFIDFLVVTAIFLLMFFSARADCADKNVNVPWAGNVWDVIDAPMVTVSGNQLLVDGVFTESSRTIEELGRAQKIDALFSLLKSKRELWQSLQPGKPFPGEVILQLDHDVSAVVVKSVFQTAAYAGFPTVSFLVKKLPPAP
jgi:biopolymer transport protein ExbD